MQEALQERAVRVVTQVAREYGIGIGSPQVLSHWSNVLIHLKPAPIVARVAATTALVRPDVKQRQAREIALAKFLYEAGIPVVPPSPMLPPGPHESDGMVFSFWTHVALVENAAPRAEEMGPLLKTLHETLRSYSGELSNFNRTIAEIKEWIDYASKQSILTAIDADMLRKCHAEITAWFAHAHFPIQALHGDAQALNVLRSADGRLLWNDFEDACYGPIEWDLTCFARRLPGGPETALRHYSAAPEWQSLSPFLAVRQLQGTVWYAILASQGLTSADTVNERINAWQSWAGMPA